MEYLQMIQQVELYFFAALYAAAGGWFFYGMDLVFSKRVKSYERSKRGKSMMFVSLAAMVLIMIVWLVVHMVVVALV